MQPTSGPAIFSTAWKKRLLAAGVVAGTALAVFFIEQGGTYLILRALQAGSGTGSMTELAGWLVAWAASSGVGGVGLSVVVATALQLLPIFNSLLLAMILGAMWGMVLGVVVASAGACLSSVACLLISRHGLRDIIAKRAGKHPLVDAVGGSISASLSKSLFFTALVRLSPVINFVWSNYLFGLTPMRVVPYAVGTAVGTLPTLLTFVSAGVVGKNIADGGASPPPALLVVGGVATLIVIFVIGKVAQQELAKLSKGSNSPKNKGLQDGDDFQDADDFSGADHFAGADSPGTQRLMSQGEIGTPEPCEDLPGSGEAWDGPASGQTGPPRDAGAWDRPASGQTGPPRDELGPPRDAILQGLNARSGVAPTAVVPSVDRRASVG